jgi:hypothetical protein
MRVSGDFRERGRIKYLFCLNLTQLKYKSQEFKLLVEVASASILYD